MLLSELLNFHDNAYRIGEICKQRKKIIPFVGAGVSIGCGYLSWIDLLDKLAEDYFDEEERKKLKDKGDVFEYADAIAFECGNTDMLMRRVQEIIKSTSERASEIPYLLVSSFSDLVVTTNYDTLLENASCKSLSGNIKALLPVLKGQMNEAIQLNQRCLLKIHGSVEEITSIILTSEQYDNFYGKDGNQGLIAAYLKKIFEGEKVLFIGCSLNKDRTLEILEEAVRNNPGISHYAIVPFLNDEKEQRKCNKRYSTLGLVPIFYPEGDYEAINYIVNYISGDNYFIRILRNELCDLLSDDRESTALVDVLIAIAKKSFYHTCSKYPLLLDVDSREFNCFQNDSLRNALSVKQTDTIMDVCLNAFHMYIKIAALNNVDEVFYSFREIFHRECLAEQSLVEILELRWDLQRNITYTENENFAWIQKLQTEDLENFANILIGNLQYRNGMDFSLVHPSYIQAKVIANTSIDRLSLRVAVCLLNCLGAMSHYYNDSQDGISFLKCAIKMVEKNGNNDSHMMLLKSKCFANLALTLSTCSSNITEILEAAEEDMKIKKRYDETGIYYSRSLNFYATVQKEIDPFAAIDSYIESEQIKKRMYFANKSPELYASWATTVFNIGLLAKDLSFYEKAYSIIDIANKMRFLTVSHTNRDYCSSLNVMAEIEVILGKNVSLGEFISCVKSRTDLPVGFVNTTDHTWYVLAYYYFAEHDVQNAQIYISKCIEEMEKNNVINDFRFYMRVRLLLANVRFELGKIQKQYIEESRKEYLDIIKNISEYYGEDSFYLITPYEEFVKRFNERSEIHQNRLELLLKKYKERCILGKEKIDKYIVDLNSTLEF